MEGTSQIQSANAAATAEKNRNSVELSFMWGVGIECSFLPHLNVDQFDWTQHSRFWKEDLKMIRDVLGVKHLRYALP